MPNAARKSRKWWLYLLLLTVIAVAGVAAGQARIEVLNRLAPVAQSPAKAVTIIIPPGTSTYEVAELLFSKGLIRDPLVFRYYARYRNLDNKLMSGEYRLSPAMTPDEILQRLTGGMTVVRRFTVPEGLTVREMADLLARQGIVDRDRFLKAALNSKLNAAYLPPDVKLAEPLEGYLFPATYEYDLGITEEQVLAMMFTRFEEVWTPQRRERAKALGLTVHEAVTLASIVESEAQAGAERPVIAGVYHNRLAIGMKLDADPTVGYAVARSGRQELTLEDLKVESPYNTYRVAGLPPGPIGAPGESSMLAALNPAKHEYLYFVAKADGTGEHYFAGTLEQQTENMIRAENNAKKR